MAGRNTEKISSVELWSVMFIFIVASSMIVPTAAVAGNKSWIAVIIAIIMASGYALVYTALCDSYPGKSLVEIGELLIGSLGGKVLGLLYAFYGFQFAAFLMKDHWYFTSAVALPNTPVIVVASTMMILVIWITYSGIEAIVRVSTVFVPIVVLYTLSATILLSKDMDLRNLLPIFDGKWREILYAGLQTSITPLGGAVVFTMVFPQLSKKGEAKKPSLFGVTAAGVIILCINITNILVLGTLRLRLLYPAFTSYSYIQVADFLDRAEITIFTLFITVNFIKMSIAFYVAALCIARVFSIDNYRIFLVPLGFLVLEQSLFIVRNQAEFTTFLIYTWPWYSIIFVFFIPLLLLAASFVKNRKRRAE